MIRVEELTAYHASIPLRKQVRHASHSRTENDTLLIRCRLSDGTVGWGEGLPRPYVTGETIDTAWELLESSGWEDDLGGGIASLEDVIPLLTDINFGALPADQRDCFGNSVRCAVELAVLDAYCRSFGKPLSAVTSLLPETEPIRHSVESVHYSGIITPMTRWEEVKFAYGHRRYKFRQCKVKVGVPGVSDRWAVWWVRLFNGKDFSIRLDANEAWHADEVAKKMRPLLKYGIESLEQPIPHAQVAQMVRVRRECPVPMMLDESLCSESDAYKAIENGWCDLFNLRLSKCGGFLPSLRLAALAHQHGIGYQLGCQVGETGILSAAGRHFAQSVANIRFLEGSFDRFLVAEPLTKEDISFSYGGYAPALTGPGLSVTVDEEAVARVTIRRQQWRLGRSGLEASRRGADSQ